MTYEQFIRRLAKLRRRHWRVTPIGRIRLIHDKRADTCPVVAVADRYGIGAWRAGRRLGLTEWQVGVLIEASDKRHGTPGVPLKHFPLAIGLRRRMLHALGLD